MGLDIDEAELRIDEIFRAKVKSCAFERSFVLRVAFEEKTDIGTVIKKNPYTGAPANGELYDLSREVPLIVFDNAFCSRMPNAPISNTRSDTNVLEQDPFHFDFLGEKMNDRSKSSILFNPNDVSREAPTYFALPEHVRLAITEMSPLGIPDAALEALKKMGAEDYAFSLEPDERKVRDVIIKEFPEFTDQVYANIPTEAKFAHTWAQGHSTVTMHINDSEQLLHARGGSETDHTNQITVYDFYPY